MNKAEEQIIENMVNALHSKGVEFDWFTKHLHELSDLSREKYRVLTQAALDTLDIIILEEGAEPMVGDLITARFKRDSGHGTFEYEDMVEILPFLDRLKWLEDIKIIQRLEDGKYKPVITVEEVKWVK